MLKLLWKNKRLVVEKGWQEGRVKQVEYRIFRAMKILCII
jgi:hypothetical protein